MTTVNDELRSRNHEITQANNDLTNLLAGIDVAVVMLGSDLAIRRFTPEAQKLLGLIPADVGRPFENINAGLNVPDLHDQIVNVITDLTPFEREVRVRSGRKYVLRATPYRTSENRIEGAVITFIGVPKTLLESERGEAAATETAEFMLVLDPELRVKSATPSFYHAFQLTPESIRDRPLHCLRHLVADNPELQKALEKAQKTNEAIAPFTMELKTDSWRHKFECRVDRITLDGGAKVITLAMRPPAGDTANTQTNA